MYDGTMLFHGIYQAPSNSDLFLVEEREERGGGRNISPEGPTPLGISELTPKTRLKLCIVQTRLSRSPIPIRR